MNHLHFRRQFLLTPRDISTLSEWPRHWIRSHWLYSHPDLPVTIHDEPDVATFALAGFALDPADTSATDEGVLRRLASTWGKGDRTSVLNSITGRFALFVFDGDDIFVYNDATGMRAVEYTWTDGEFHAASQALLLEHAVPLDRGDRLREFEESAYRAFDLEAFLPAGVTVFENVDRLIPNHVLRVSTRRQERYWPVAPIASDADPDTVASVVSESLSRTLIGAQQRFRLALTLTAGWDSRSVLSAAGPVLDDLYVYALRYRHLSKRSPDLAIPRRILRRLGVEQHIIDCRREASASWLTTYAANSATAHLDDWGTIAAGIYQGFPSDRVAVKGNACEIGRTIYWYENDGSERALDSAEQVVAQIEGWSDIPFIRDSIDEWFAGARVAADATGVPLEVLFHWEHRCGSWQAQSQLEWDIAQEVLAPFNNRDLLELTLTVAPELRGAPDFLLSRKIMTHGGLDVLREPVNPNGRSDRALELLQKGMYRMRREIRKLRSRP